jgi:hypothetical protein
VRKLGRREVWGGKVGEVREGGRTEPYMTSSIASMSASLLLTVREGAGGLLGAKSAVVAVAIFPRFCNMEELSP